MTTVKFLHTADWQLGMRRHFLNDDSLPRFMQARIDVIRTIAELAANEQCAFVVVSGDVWESNQLDRRTIGLTRDALAAVPCPIYLLPGNHDPLDAGSVFRTRNFLSGKPANVHVLESAEPVEVAPGVRVMGVPWPSKRAAHDLVAEACDRLESKPDYLTICVGHGIVDKLSPNAHEPSHISFARMQTATEQGQVQYFALGDRHSTTELAPRIWYSGAPEPTDYNELDSGNVLLVQLSDDACQVTRHRTGKWQFVRETLEFSSGEDVDAAARHLQKMPNKEVTILKLALKGALGLAAVTQLESELDKLRDLFAALEIWGQHTDLVVLPDQLDLDKLDLAGFARATAQELQGAASSTGADAAIARDALALLYRLTMQVQS
jgi:DNA repair exonuclease SbcCD nuclease subunit